MVEIETPYYKDLRYVKLPDLSPLSGKNILVTGATGLIGGCLIDLLSLYSSKYNFKLYAGCRNENITKQRFNKDSEVNCVLIDVSKEINLDIRVDYIINAASPASPNMFASDPVGIMKANLFGVCNLIEYGINHSMERFLHVSTGEIYGEGCEEEWKEEDSGYIDPMKVRSAYPSSKRTSETLCAAYSYQYNVDIVIARLCHTYGPFFKPNDNRVYAQFINNVLKGSDIVLKSRGEQYRSWLYVVDCAAALIYLLLNGKSGEAYNVANQSSNIKINELAQLVAELGGCKVVFDLPTGEVNTLDTPITKAVFNTDKINKLGWTSDIDIRTGFEHTITTLFMKQL